jgi:hypothetical protein
VVFALTVSPTRVPLHLIVILTFIHITRSGTMALPFNYV